MTKNQLNQIKKRKLPYQIEKFKIHKFHHFQPGSNTNAIEPLIESNNNNKKLKKKNCLTSTNRMENNVNINTILPDENTKQLLNQLNSNREIMDSMFNQFQQLYNSINFQSPLSNYPFTNNSFILSTNNNNININNNINNNNNNNNINNNNNNNNLILPNMIEDLFLNIPESLKDETIQENEIQSTIVLFPQL
ncbi:hypothetical protein ACTA71_009135 [Dictyostelium dimigraforme]